VQLSRDDVTVHEGHRGKGRTGNVNTNKILYMDETAHAYKNRRKVQLKWKYVE
jgi:hypothetical protein